MGHLKPLELPEDDDEEGATGVVVMVDADKEDDDEDPGVSTPMLSKNDEFFNFDISKTVSENLVQRIALT